MTKLFTTLYEITAKYEGGESFVTAHTPQARDQLVHQAHIAGYTTVSVKPVPVLVPVQRLRQVVAA